MAPGIFPRALAVRVRTPKFSGWAESSRAKQFRAVWNYYAGSGRILWVFWRLLGREVVSFCCCRGTLGVPTFRGCSCAGSAAGRSRLGLNNSVPSGIIEAVNLVYSSSTTSRRESCSLLSAQNRSIVGNIPESGAFLLDNASKLPDFVRTKCSAPHSVRLNQQPLLCGFESLGRCSAWFVRRRCAVTLRFSTGFSACQGCEGAHSRAERVDGVSG